MATTTAIVRGEAVEVEYRNYGYEPDTNAHVIDWHFVEDMKGKLELSDVEQDDVYQQLAELSNDAEDDYWDNVVI